MTSRSASAETGSTLGATANQVALSAAKRWSADLAEAADPTRERRPHGPFAEVGSGEPRRPGRHRQDGPERLA